MSVIHAFPSPILTASDWAVVFIGLLVGVVLIFQFIKLTVRLRKKEGNKIYNVTNFWLILSGVIHVSL